MFTFLTTMLIIAADVAITSAFAYAGYKDQKKQNRAAANLLISAANQSIDSTNQSIVNMQNSASAQITDSMKTLTSDLSTAVSAPMVQYAKDASDASFPFSAASTNTAAVATKIF